MITIIEEGKGKKKKPYYRRTFNFIIKNEEHFHNPVVYLITIGEKYYIGKADKYRRRVSQHISTFNSINWTPGGSTRIQENSSYHLIRNYLIENPQVEDIIFEVIELCVDTEDAERTEFHWFLDIRTYNMYDLFLNYDQVHKDFRGHLFSDDNIQGMGLYCL